jgi:hypothetical protein
MKTIDFKDIEIKGELAVRSGLNFARLEGQWYRPDEVFKADSHGWPADWEGRIVLALTLLAQSTHRTPAYLDEIVSRIPEHLNEKGYFGPILPEGRFDEQHFGGHNWIIRGLIEYYYLKKDEKVKSILERLIRNFLLPARGAFAKYPIEPVKRFEDQGTWILSKLQTKTKHHAETSDAGCAFIILDGASQAFGLFGWPELKELVEEIIARFMEMDLTALHIQTHATLSAIRGILRFYGLTGNPGYLDMALKVFDLYKSRAWTECYGNYNWFGAPRWTEPCAIIDSFMVSVTLWKHTRRPVFLEDAHRVYFNALCHGYRFNGSFGTDRCCGARETEDTLFLAPINFETYWCCTMRGGEGLSRAIEYNFFLDGDSVYVPFYNNCTATLRFGSGVLRVEEKTLYPYEGSVALEVLESSVRSSVRLKFFSPLWSGKGDIAVYRNGDKMPSSYENGFLTVEGAFERGDRIDFDLGLTAGVEDTSFENSVQGFHKFSYGPMLLGYKTGVEINSLEGNRFENYAESKYKSANELYLSRDTRFDRIGKGEFRARGSEVVLSCLCDVRDLTREDSMRQILFRNP